MLLMTITEEKINLINTIESLREEMILIGIQEGFASEKTIQISQKLDGYIVKYQTLNH